ncbi:serine/threonine-protein kinase [Enemella sp. A6]|uniref:serine/threonine-protein kinase n=1 Tax=Enemella sp. A6 TaxID=3440152 RepID=UPI003EBBEAC6
MTSKRTPAPPPELPGYRVLQHLGSGGFADVFLYEQDLPRRKVAVKVLIDSAVDDSVRQRFISEANAMAQVSTHPSIVSIFFAGIAPDGRPCLVMEYCPKPNLSVRLRRERIPVPEALRIGIRLASAVATAHNAGILHRDIKPANVLVTEYGWPALTDFGISAQIDANLERLDGLSVPWSAPEQFNDLTQPDWRTDVYSLGATVYALLAGRSPFEVFGGNNSTTALISRIEREPVPSTGRDDVPPLLEQVLARSLHKRTEARFRSALELAQALQGVEMAMGLTPTAIEVMDTGQVTESEAEEDTPTRMRGVVTIDQDDGSTSAASTASTRYRIEDEDGPPRRPLMLVIGSIAAVLVIGVIVGVLLFVDPPPPPQGPEKPTPEQQTAQPVQAPGAVTDLACESTGGQLSCTWTQPDGDVPVQRWSWSWTERPADATTVGDPKLNTEVPEGLQPCIQVVALGDNGRSSEPVSRCAAG